jgi:hypothetical protein
MMDITNIIKSDEAICKALLDYFPDNFIDNQGLKRAPGEEWEFQWCEVTEMEVEMHKSINAQPPPYGIGQAAYFLDPDDWHLRATTLVVRKEC